MQLESLLKKATRINLMKMVFFSATETKCLKESRRRFPDTHDFFSASSFCFFLWLLFCSSCFFSILLFYLKHTGNTSSFDTSRMLPVHNKIDNVFVCQSFPHVGFAVVRDMGPHLMQQTKHMANQHMEGICIPIHNKNNANKKQQP